MVIDTNMYWFPEDIFTSSESADALLADISEHDDTFAYFRQKGPDGPKEFVIERPKGYPGLNFVQGEYTLEKQLSDMDSAGVEKAVLKISCLQEYLSLEMCRYFNDGMAAHARASGGRLIALGVLPPAGSPEVFAEAERCMGELGMHGFQLTAHYGGHYLDYSGFASFFEYLNGLKATVYIHHVPVPVQYDSIYEFNDLRRTYGRCADQCTAVGRELFSGFFDRYPDLRFVHSMLGGGFFAYMSMFFPPASNDSAARFSCDTNAKKHLKENIFFEMSHAAPWGKQQLECAAAVMGADHILFGSSYPVRREWLTGGPDFVRSLDIPAEDAELILGENARLLYHID